MLLRTSIIVMPTASISKKITFDERREKEKEKKRKRPVGNMGVLLSLLSLSLSRSDEPAFEGIYRSTDQ